MLTRMDSCAKLRQIDLERDGEVHTVKSDVMKITFGFWGNYYLTLIDSKIDDLKHFE